jgi:hypothetical protein
MPAAPKIAASYGTVTSYPPLLYFHPGFHGNAE